MYRYIHNEYNINNTIPKKQVRQWIYIRYNPGPEITATRATNNMRTRLYNTYFSEKMQNIDSKYNKKITKPAATKISPWSNQNGSRMNGY